MNAQKVPELQLFHSCTTHSVKEMTILALETPEFIAYRHVAASANPGVKMK